MRATTIRNSRTLAGRFRGGKLHPSMCLGLKGSEGGLLTQTATIELDPVAGRLITPVTAEMIVVYVPVQDMLALLHTGDATAGITEVIRQTYGDGQDLFGLVDEDEVTRRMGVMPISIGGVKKVNQAAKLAHICAVNYLRKRKYAYAATLPYPTASITPALYSSTVLSRFNAVLNPDDHVGGMVSLTMSMDSVPVTGIGLVGSTSQPSVSNVMDGDNKTRTFTQGASAHRGDQGASVVVRQNTGSQGPEFAGYPVVKALTADLEAGGFSLTDLYNVQVMDRLTREMRQIVESNPVDGEDQVVRWAYGLKVDDAQTPFVLFEREIILGQDLLKAMDGAGIEAEVTQSRLMARISATVPVPKTELGGVVVTFLTVKPDEVLKEQPDPVLAQPWAFDNLMVQELQNDPVAVLGREVEGSVAQGSETAVMFYTGFNELRRTYVNYGWNRQVDPETVDAKNAMWQIEIPASVTPENIVYPEDIDHYPFVDQDAEVARYMLASSFVGKSPIYIGPSPVETVSVIESEDLFGEVDE